MTSSLLVRDLELLRAIRDQGSLAGAARLLHWAQPTMSHHLAALESRFGVRMVDRGPRGARLTEIGAAIARHADEILGRLGVAEGELARHAEGEVLTLRVGTIPSPGTVLLARAIPRLEQTGLRLAIVEGEAPELLAMIRRRELHLALTSAIAGEDLHQPPGIEDSVLHTDQFLLVLPRSHRLASRPVVDLEDLGDDVWISARHDGDPCHQLLVRACRRRGFEPDVVYRIDDHQLTEALVVSTGCVALLPALQLARSAPGVVVRRISGPPVAREIRAARLAAIARAATDRVIAEIRGIAADAADAADVAGWRSAAAVRGDSSPA